MGDAPTPIQPLSAAVTLQPVARRRSGWLGLLPTFVLLASVMSVMFYSCSGPVVPRVVWSTGSTATAPDGFTYLQFPISDAIKMLDAPDGAAQGVLARALANTVGESRTPGWVTVGDGGVVRESELAFEPPASTSVAYIENYERRLRQKTGDRAATVSWSVDRSAGSPAYRLVRHFDDSIDMYEYAVSAGAVVPLKYSVVHGAAVGFDAFVRFMKWIWIPPVLWVVCWVGVLVARRR